MRTLHRTPHLDTSDLLSRVIFGGWVIVRTRSADEIEAWIDDAMVGPSVTDLDEIAAAIRRLEAGHDTHTPTALAA